MHVAFELQYAFPKHSNVDCITASEVDLVYFCFMGKLTLLVQGIDFGNPKTGLIDSCLSISRVLKEVMEVGEAHLDWPEGGEGIQLSLRDDHLTLLAEYSPEVRAECRLSEFSDHFYRESSLFLHQVVHAYPCLRENACFVAMVSESPFAEVVVSR